MKQILSRVWAVLILLFLIGLVWQLIFMPIWSSVAVEREQMGQFLERIARQQIIEERAREYTKWLADYPERVVLDRIYAARTVNAAETLMQRDLTAAAQGSGAVVSSIEGAPSKKVADFVQLTMRVNLSANPDQLMAFLQKLQGSDRVITVSKSSVRVRRAEDEFGPADLGVSLELIAFGKV